MNRASVSGWHFRRVCQRREDYYSYQEIDVNCEMEHLNLFDPQHGPQGPGKVAGSGTRIPKVGATGRVQVQVQDLNLNLNLNLNLVP